MKEIGKDHDKALSKKQTKIDKLIQEKDELEAARKEDIRLLKIEIDEKEQERVEINEKLLEFNSLKLSN